MTPRLVTLLKTPPAGDPAAWPERVPAGRRDRLTVAWPGAASSPPLALLAAARRAGFTRIRLAGPASEFGAAALADAVAAGLDEAEVRLDGPGPWDALRDLRASGRLAFTAVREGPAARAGGGEPGNPCGADAFVLEVPAGGPSPGDDRRLGVASSRFRRLAVRGWPLCAFPSLAEDRVVSNALVAEVGGPADPGGGWLRVPFEEPSRLFAEACGTCRLAFACDGLPAVAAVPGGALVVRLRPFGAGTWTDVRLDPSALAVRAHPATFLSGRVHVLGVAAGARPCGRVVVDAADAARQEEALRRLGLATALVPLPAGPRDRDAGAGARGAGLHHVFFSRGDEAAAAADLEIRFARSQEGASPMDPVAFSRDLGRLLGYPDCCVEAFAAAGPDATTSDLLRRAHGRSRAFAWPLNVLDPVSPFTLVPHLPCAFDCRPSLDLAERVAAALDGVFPFLRGAAARALGRPWLWWDAARGLALAGPADPDGLGAACGLPDSPLTRAGVRPDPAARAFLGRVLPALAAGDRVRIDGDAVRVLRDGRPVADLSEGPRPLIFPFVQE